MAALTTVAAVGGLALAAGSTYMSYQQQRRANANQRRAAEEARNINAETAARNAQEAANERRNQIREERVRRARILQTARNTGTQNSSGEMGSVGAISTNLSSNLGFNLGSIAAANRISGYSQRQADFMSAAQGASNRASLWNQASGLGSNIFGASGGFSTLKTAWDRL